MKTNHKFGVWMDTIHATIVEADVESGNLKIVTHITAEEHVSHENEKTENNQKIMLQGKYFKDISAQLQNATYVHVTGTGQAQEQFMHYLAKNPQYKNTKTDESTSNKMTDAGLIEFLKDKLN